MKLKYIIVLGQSLLENNVMKKSLISRIDTAINIYYNFSNANEVVNTTNITNFCRLVLSGGITTSSTVSEAKVMHDYIKECCRNSSLANLFPVSHNIILEEKSSNTIENAINSYNLIEFMTDSLISNCSRISSNSKISCDIVVISNDFHVPRTKCIFETIFKLRNQRRLSNKKIIFNLSFVSSPSFLSKNIYRSNRNLRPLNIDEWSFEERLDIEINAIQNLLNQLKSYNLFLTDGNVHDDDILAILSPDVIMRTLEQIEILKQDAKNIIL